MELEQPWLQYFLFQTKRKLCDYCPQRITLKFVKQTIEDLLHNDETARYTATNTSLKIALLAQTVLLRSYKLQ